MSYFCHFIYVTLEFIHTNHPFRTFVAKKIPASLMKLGFTPQLFGLRPSRPYLKNMNYSARRNTVKTGTPINGTKIADTIISKIPLKPATPTINQPSKPVCGMPVKVVCITVKPIHVKPSTKNVLIKADNAPRPTSQIVCCPSERFLTKRQ